MIEIVPPKEPTLTPEEVRNLCVKHGWFTAGSLDQYNKLFDLVEWDYPLRDLATVIWLCSDRKSKKEIETALITAAKGKAAVE